MNIGKAIYVGQFLVGTGVLLVKNVLMKKEFLLMFFALLIA